MAKDNLKKMSFDEARNLVHRQNKIDNQAKLLHFSKKQFKTIFKK